MRNIFRISFTGLYIFLVSVTLTSGQTKFQKFRLKLGTIICYGDNKVNRTYIPPSYSLLLGKGEGPTKTADIIVSYRGFSPEAKNAFEYAVSIWETLIVSDIPIYMEANWTSMSEGALGSYTPNSFYLGNHVNGMIAKAYYPGPLAEKLLKKEITGEHEPDFSTDFNKSANWYYGTNGAAPADKYDLVSVVLHEIGHGLGFIGTMGTTGTDHGTYGFANGLTITFDHYLENYNGELLTDTSIFDVPSNALFNVLTGNLLYFDGPVERNNNTDHRARLYAPDEFNQGSSVYHLDEDIYSGTNENILMTPFISKGEAMHYPGPITMGMVQDWGWIHTWIDHEPITDLESATPGVVVPAIVTSDTIYHPDSVYMVWSYDKFSTCDTTFMAPTGVENEFTDSIPVDTNDLTVSYYLAAIDYFGRTYTSPSGAPGNYYQFYAGPDTIKPVIEHFPTGFLLVNEDTLKIEATVTDNIGIDSVYVAYFVNNKKEDSVRLLNDSLNDYSAKIIFGSGTLVAGDSVRYRIVAVDSSQNANSATFPENGEYITVNVEDIKLPQNEYENNFNSPTDDFLMTGFSIITASGFDNGGLNTKHPYESPDQDNKTLEYIAQLKIPIILKESDSYMLFDNIALVEPGEAGTNFGDDEFWDYVIVEGSKNEGITWQPIADGYDCRKHTSWLTRYNSAISGNNSTATGTSSLFEANMINLLGSDNFSGGDTILIRFRLFSDPYAHGWGWIIDNLKIQGAVSSVNNILREKTIIKVYPNPIRDQFNIEISFPTPINELDISVLDLTGRIILKKQMTVNGQFATETIDLSEAQSGLYLIKLKAGNHIWYKKVMKLK